MNLQENLIQLRKQKGYSQEEMAYQLGVSRQSVSKWESGTSIPELDRLIEISEMFDVTLDELVRGEKLDKKEYYISDEQLTRVVRKSRDYEYKSQISICGLPLVHVNIGRGRKVAKGIFAFGNTAIGIFAFGGIGIGLVGAGGIGVGILSLAGIAVGGLAIGGFALGLFAIGGMGIGLYAIGGFAFANDIAIGGKVIGHVAIGASPTGDYIVETSSRILNKEVYEAIHSLPISIPGWLEWLFSFMK